MSSPLSRAANFIINIKKRFGQHEMKSKDFKACLDYPNQSQVENIFRATGWFVDQNGRCADSIVFLIDGVRMFAATRMVRMDVAAAFPKFPFSGSAGFFGDIIVPTERLGSPFKLSIEFSVNGVVHLFDAGKFIASTSNIEYPPIAEKSFSYEKILKKPSNSQQYMRAGARVYHEVGSVPMVRLLEGGVTHGYSDEMIRIISSNADGVVLDLGCGIRPESARFPNVALLDAVQFPHVEIVSLCDQLPFQDNSIDAIVSNAVYEHLPDPFGMATEIYRILKPGGVAHICTAFMQPFHGDPDHYFNMTLPGLKTVFRKFEITDEGVEVFQKPSFGLQMQMESVRPFLSAEAWDILFADFNANIIANRNLLDYSNELLTRTLAAGVFVTARKPEHKAKLSSA